MNNGAYPTPEHLVPFEAAARIYCERQGLNPDDGVPVPHPLIANLTMQIPMWYDVAERLLDLSALLSCMKAAKDAQPQIVVPH
jgi:hypothetical protein